jgi:ABC-type transporter lipoprotein component MlaA/pimeloyl-ACP methyl ester carboxylesterase
MCTVTRFFATVLMLMAVSAPVHAETNTVAAPSVNLPEPIPDPAEPVNRAIWSVNKGLIKGVVSPVSKGYRMVVIKPARVSISHFGYNVKYPGRLLNNLLEADFPGAGNETIRFLCNTLGGVGGLFDVTGNEIPKSDANFAKTFAQWGWKPDCFLMLPLLGPSSDRDALGTAADAAANPITYFTPYSYSSYGFAFNDLSDSVDRYKRLSESESDPYSIMRLAQSFSNPDRKPTWPLSGPTDEATLETLQAAAFGVKDPEFPGRGKTRSVLIPATGKSLKYTYWVQSRPAPIVYILPGLGAHRLSDNTLGLAELIYRDGYSVACISNPYNYEFMASASTAAMPAYTPTDARDAQNALSEIDRQLRGRYPGRLGAKALLGYSMGAFQALYLAATETAKPPIQFDRYVSINAPVRLLYGVSKLDEFYQAPLAWPENDRTNRLENTFRKLFALRDNPMIQSDSARFDAVESKFLIGLMFRLTLRDVIYNSQQRTNLGLIKQPLRQARREAVYQEIMRYSYNDYFDQFVLPYYRTKGLVLKGRETMEKISDLHTYTDKLKANRNIRIVTNQNDFLLADGDLDWLRSTFKAPALTIFEHGGHLGNLAQPAPQKAILAALDGLKKRP